MRKISDQGKTIYISDRFEEIRDLAEGILEYPFEAGLLNLLKEENRLRQEYVFRVSLLPELLRIPYQRRGNAV